MTLDEDLLAEVEAARDHLESLEDDAYEARARFHQSVRRLHGAGGSMREIAAALSMSHQRVHQIIGEDAIVEVEATSSEVRPFPAASSASSSSSVALTATEDACSFCGAPRRELDKLLAAPGNAFVCNGCVTRARRALAVSEDAARCSFCGSDRTARYEENDAVICDSCIGVCERLLSSDEPRRATMRRNPKLRCSFCNISTSDVTRLIAGPGSYICPACVTVGLGVASTGSAAPGPRSTTMRPATNESHPCTFCGRTTPSVPVIVKGGRARICSECLDVCEGVLTEDA